jgi:site-specific DNA-methyltransferase (adenine-specific)
LRTLYSAVGGKYYAGDDAWQYVNLTTDIDLLGILTRIAD